MTAYTLSAAHGSFGVTGNRPILIHRDIKESQWVVNRFNRWSENNTNGETVTYRTQPSSFGPTIYYGIQD